MILRFSNKRMASGLFIGAFGTLVVSLGGWWFTLGIGVIVHLALLEFFRMAEFTGIRPATKTTLVACQLILISSQLQADGIISSELNEAIVPLSGAAICGWLILQPLTGSIADIAASIFGLFYLGFLPSHWLKLRNLSEIDIISSMKSSVFNLNYNFNLGMIITFVACLIIVVFDIGSLVIGRYFGRNPLSPISPGKTIEGAFGGLAFSMFVGSISFSLFQVEFGFLYGAILGFLVALFALVGDLTESMMKRNAGIKDSGNVIPGHGGILDRIDSYLFTPAVVYYTLVLFSPIP